VPAKQQHEQQRRSSAVLLTRVVVGLVLVGLVLIIALPEHPSATFRGFARHLGAALRGYEGTGTTSKP
jgi:hypothetical protein